MYWGEGGTGKRTVGLTCLLINLCYKTLSYSAGSPSLAAGPNIIARATGLQQSNRFINCVPTSVD